MASPPPRVNRLLFGHDDAEATLLEAMAGERMHHAWLITGPEGIGKATLAFRFVRHLLGALDGPAASRVAAGTHADLFTLEREFDDKKKRLRGEIIIDDVRKVTDFLHLTPAEGGWRVVVVDGAEYMNRNAANGLLKVLEEPPERAILLLVCATPGWLLQTIRSRCRVLGLRSLDDAAMERVLAAALPASDAADRARLIGLAEGSPGRALALAEGRGLEFAQRAARLISALPAVDMLAALDLADTVAAAEDGFGDFMDLLRHDIAARVRSAARGAAGSITGPAWVERWQALTRLQHETEQFNLDKRQALIQALTLLSAP